MWICYTNRCSINNSNIASSDLNEKGDTENMISGDGFWGQIASTLMVILIAFNDYVLVFCNVFEGEAEYDVSAAKWKGE